MSYNKANELKPNPRISNFAQNHKGKTINQEQV